MTRVYVELSQESLPLAQAEAEAVGEVAGGRPSALPAALAGASLWSVELPEGTNLAAWTERLALARRCLAEVGGAEESLEDVALREGSRGKTGAIRWLGHPSGPADPLVATLGRRYKEGGGRIDLGSPERRFWLLKEPKGPVRFFEEVGRAGRASVAERRMPLLPFQRPVSLPPRLARAAANLARIPPRGRVLDPFLGTGALLAEAGLLGGRIYGIDLDPAMVRGALRNLAFVGAGAEELLVGDAGEVDFADPELRFDALLTDPPYGRSSSTGGEEAAPLLRRVLARWAARVGEGGTIVLVVPAGVDAGLSGWTEALSVPVRVHRSLTREFRVYRRETKRAPNADVSRPSA